MISELEWTQGSLIFDFKRVGIGRLPTNRIVLDNDTLVSGMHAEIIPTEHGCLLIDLGSMNGTFVNDKRLLADLPYVLHSGDRIRIGKTELRFWIRVLPPQQQPVRRVR